MKFSEMLILGVCGYFLYKSLSGKENTTPDNTPSSSSSPPPTTPPTTPPYGTLELPKSFNLAKDTSVKSVSWVDVNKGTVYGEYVQDGLPYSGMIPTVENKIFAGSTLNTVPLTKNVSQAVGYLPSGKTFIVSEASPKIQQQYAQGLFRK